MRLTSGVLTLPHRASMLSTMPTDQDEPGQTLNVDDAGAELFTALSKAQAQVETVGKDAHNSQQRYAYASAEAMIRGSRRALTDNGLALLTTWSRQPIDASHGDIGNQFVCANVKLHFVLTHASGQCISGTAEMDAIGSRARPPDKAVAATLTYMHGFVLRGLLNIDRADEDSDAVDRRTEGDYQHRPAPPRAHTPPRAATRTVTREPEDPAVVVARTNARELAAQYLSACADAGAPVDFDGVARAALGETFDRKANYSVVQWEALAVCLARAIATLADPGPPDGWDSKPKPEDESQ